MRVSDEVVDEKDITHPWFYFIVHVHTCNYFFYLWILMKRLKKSREKHLTLWFLLIFSHLDPFYFQSSFNERRRFNFTKISFISVDLLSKQWGRRKRRKFLVLFLSGPAHPKSIQCLTCKESQWPIVHILKSHFNHIM